MPPRTTIRDQIAARRTGAKASTPAQRVDNARAAAGPATATTAGSDELEDRTVDGQIRRAVKSGKLDIASLNLPSIPSDVYTTLLGIPPDQLSSPPPRAADIDGLARTLKSTLGTTELSREQPFGQFLKRAEWVEPEELTSFRASDNSLEVVEVEIGAFGGLKTVDLSRNRLTTLPSSFPDLLRLTHVDLSYNSLTAVPPAVLLLPKLEYLDLSFNAIPAINLSNPIEPSNEGLSYGAGFLSTSFSRASTKGPKAIWPSLRSLNLSHNKLSNDGLAGLATTGGLKAIRVLNLEANELEDVLDVDVCGMGSRQMPELAKLVLSANKYLRRTSGDLATSAAVEMKGCDVSDAHRPRGNTKAPASDADPGPSLAIPKPDFTLVYRTCPAATFDSEPLEIDLDIYLPRTSPKSSSGYPLVIWFHGGGLLQGNKENLPPHFRRLPSHAYPDDQHVAVISPNYRLAPQVPILDILNDVTALLDFVRTKLNDRLTKAGKPKVDPSRICLSGGSAGGYLALIAGLALSKGREEEVGGFRGDSAIRCIAPFYPITDLTDAFWATEINPVPWWDRSIPHEEARPHIDLKAAPVKSAISGGPRSILYPYMLQHALFPSLLFQKQRSVGAGVDSFRPTPEMLSITYRLRLMTKDGLKPPPVYLVYGTIDDKVQPMDWTVECLDQAGGELVVEKMEGVDHAFDEEPGVECEGFRKWLGGNLL